MAERVEVYEMQLRSLLTDYSFDHHNPLPAKQRGKQKVRKDGTEEILRHN